MKKNQKKVFRLNKFKISKLNALGIKAGDDNTVLGGDGKRKSGNLFCISKVEIDCKLESIFNC